MPAKPARILGIAGSLRAGSHNARLLRAAGAALPPGADLVVWDRLADLPHYDPDLDDRQTPAVAQDLRAALADADALLLSTPEYNGTMPGALKNAIDWGSRPRGEAALQDLPAAVVGASTGLFGAVWAQADVRRALGVAGALVLDHELPVGQADAAFGGPEDRLTDADAHGALRALLAELASGLHQDAASPPTTRVT